jgi:hypothetical protein
MAAMAKHGSEAGYDAERRSGQNVCSRCRNAHRVFARQYRPAGKAAGLKFGYRDVIDQHYSGDGKPRIGKGGARTTPTPSAVTTAGVQSEPVAGERETADVPLRQRFAGVLDGLMTSVQVPSDNPAYVADESPPDYLSSVDPDPDPIDDTFGNEPEVEYVINEAGLAKIEENLGTYLSIVGMTGSMLDPYCGSVLADQLPVMVNKWTKVIAHYPKAAELFLDGKGGIIFAWIAALQATWPVLLAFYHHHLARDIQVKDGRVFRKDNAVRPGFDGTMPPMPDNFNYSAT